MCSSKRGGKSRSANKFTVAGSFSRNIRLCNEFRLVLQSFFDLVRFGGLLFFFGKIVSRVDLREDWLDSAKVTLRVYRFSESYK